MAVMADKDYVQMAQLIRPVARRIFTVTVDSDRALQAQELARVLQEKGIEASSCPDYQVALQQAVTYPEKIIIFGSLYFIGEVLDDKNKAGGL